MFSGEMSSFEYINFNASLKQNTGDIDLWQIIHSF
jgi:hypothetical protein